MKKILTVIVALACVAAYGESKFAQHATSAEVTFAPRDQATSISAIFAKSDIATGTVKIYARGGAGRVATGANATNGAQLITLDNTGMVFNTNDVVVYDHVDGSIDKTTVSSASPSNVTLAAGISSAGATGDRLIEVTEQFRIEIGTTALAQSGGTIFKSPKDSPVYCVSDGTGTTTIAVTADR